MTQAFQSPGFAALAAGRAVETRLVEERWQAVAWDLGTDRRRVVTDRPGGVHLSEIEPDGDAIWWFDSDSDEQGRWRREPFAAWAGRRGAARGAARPPVRRRLRPDGRARGGGRRRRRGLALLRRTARGRGAADRLRTGVPEPGRPVAGRPAARPRRAARRGRRGAPVADGRRPGRQCGRGRRGAALADRVQSARGRRPRTAAGGRGGRAVHGGDLARGHRAAPLPGPVLRRPDIGRLVPGAARGADPARAGRTEPTAARRARPVARRPGARHTRRHHPRPVLRPGRHPALRLEPGVHPAPPAGAAPGDGCRRGLGPHAARRTPTRTTPAWTWTAPPAAAAGRPAPTDGSTASSAPRPAGARGRRCSWCTAAPPPTTGTPTTPG